MKLLCTASKVSWFTVGREYEVDEGLVYDDDMKRYRQAWPVEPHNGGYRTEFLDGAEFSVVPDEHEDILAAVMRMARDEGIDDMVRTNLDILDGYWSSARHSPKQQRAFLLALAHFSEEKSQ